MEQMKVLSSTRATSFGFDLAQNEFGFFLSGTKVPFATSSWVIRCHSSSLPLHKTISSGLVNSATEFTQFSKSLFSALNSFLVISASTL